MLTNHTEQQFHGTQIIISYSTIIISTKQQHNPATYDYTRVCKIRRLKIQTFDNKQ